MKPLDIIASVQDEDYELLSYKIDVLLDQIKIRYKPYYIRWKDNDIHYKGLAFIRKIEEFNGKPYPRNFEDSDTMVIAFDRTDYFGEAPSFISPITIYELRTFVERTEDSSYYAFQSRLMEILKGNSNRLGCLNWKI